MISYDIALVLCELKWILTQGLVRTGGVRITSLRGGGGSSFFTGNSAVMEKSIDLMNIYFDKNKDEFYIFVQGYSSSWYPQRKRHLREYSPISLYIFTDT